MSAPLLDVKDVVKRYAVGDRTLTALDGVSLHIEAGESVGLVGESGCGKSTLVRSILGLHKPTSGSVHLGDDELTRLGEGARRKFRPRMQVVFQDPSTSLNSDMTVHDIRPEELRYAGVQFVPTGIVVTATALVINVAPVK